LTGSDKKRKEKKEEEEKNYLEGYRISLDVNKDLDKLIFKYAFKKNAKGANDEARLCLKSVEGSG
jgi:hypothetical protein